MFNQTIQLLSGVEVGYHDFFLELTRQFSPAWRQDQTVIFSSTMQTSDPGAASLLENWQGTYHRCLNALPEDAMADVQNCLARTNPETVLLRPEIEAVWEPITTEDNWQPFYELLERVQSPFLR
jgi:serine/tyrosine/threonine adenylyltransferase